MIILYLTAVISILAKARVEEAMLDVYEDRVYVVSQLGLKIIDEKYPGEWNIRNDLLYKGNVKINDRNDILEEIGDVTGGIANIFQGNVTVATNIVVNGERRIGASADTAIAEVVLDNGEEYIGRVDISGKEYLTRYEPIKDVDGNIIGMWLVGPSIDKMDDSVMSVLMAIYGVLLFTGIVAIIITIFFSNSITRPINIINQQLKEIVDGEGDLTKEIKIKAEDEIGEVASSFNRMLGSLRKMIGQIGETSEQVAAASEELLASSEQTASATNQVVSSIQEVANIVEIQDKDTQESVQAIGEITSGVHSIVSSINTVVEATNETMS